MKIKKQKQDDKKNEIIEQSINCIEQYGVEGFSIRAVSKSMGCATGLINLYFGSKDELLKQVFVYVSGKLESDLKQISDNKDIDFDEKLKQIINVYFGNEDTILKTFNTWNALWILSRTHEKLRQARINHYSEIRKHLINIFSENQIFSDNKSDITDEFLSLMDGLWLEIGLGNQYATLTKSKDIMHQWIEKNIFYLENKGLTK